MELWGNGNTDAMQVVVMIMDSKKLSREEIEEMIKPVTYTKMLDEFVNEVVVKTLYADVLIDLRALLEISAFEMTYAPTEKQKTLKPALITLNIRMRALI